MGVSRSGFHAWLNRSPSARSRSDEAVGQQVKASFLASGRTYGARRVWRDLLGDGCLRRQSALDQPGRSLGLQDAIASSAGVFGTSGDHNSELRRHHVQPLALVFADLVQVALAAGTGLVVEVDHDLDPRQMRR
jgi:hypothetical protein